MCFGSIILSKDTDKIVVYTINNLVSIIKLLADDPLKKPEEPIFSVADLNGNEDSIKTVELQKSIYRIGLLLQLCLGQLGAIIIRDNVTSGDGSLGIMIPGIKLNCVFCIIRVQKYSLLVDIL